MFYQRVYKKYLFKDDLTLLQAKASKFKIKGPKQLCG
jgi:hypothetical protein|tara:strand:+ start:93 stop:203 length:111 start_codon:yes stop_codon:yes gene_type:complete